MRGLVRVHCEAGPAPVLSSKTKATGFGCCGELLSERAVNIFKLFEQIGRRP